MEFSMKRSWMFVPGNKQKMIDKALGLTNLDVAMLDIEDGVPPQDKETARRQIGATLASIGDRKTPTRFVRINSVGHEWMYADVAAVIQPGTEGLAVPKVDDPEQVRFLSKLLDERERQVGLPAGQIKLLLALESAKGLINGSAIGSASSRVIGMMFGAEDLSKELGLPLQREGEASSLVFYRSMLCMGAAAAHIQAVDGEWPDLDDLEGLRRHALQGRRLGMTGSSSINPKQIDTLNDVFSPTAEELAYCRKVIQLFDDGIARGEGSIAYGGQLLDLPIVERARRMVALSDALNKGKGAGV